MTYGFGAKRSHAAKLGRRVSLAQHPAVAPFVAGAAMPSSVDLSSYQPGILDQGSTGSCVGHSAAGCLATAHAAAGTPLGFIPSPRVLWTLARTKARAASPASTDQLTDTGVELADVVTGLAEYGIVPMQAPTSDGRNSDVEPSNVAWELNAGDLIAGSDRPIVGPYGADPNASDILAAALAAKIPVQMAFFADTAFMQLQPGAIAAAPNLADARGGGHATYLSGYDTRADGTRVFQLTNSWGVGWCDGGKCLVGPQWLAFAYEAWPYAVGGS